MGSNTILIVDEDFRNVEVRHAGDIKETHGFSSFKVRCRTAVFFLRAWCVFYPFFSLPSDFPQISILPAARRNHHRCRQEWELETQPALYTIAPPSHRLALLLRVFHSALVHFLPAVVRLPSRFPDILHSVLETCHGSP